MDEILSYKVDQWISAGDFLDKHSPSWTELIFASQYLPKVRQLVVGNHERVLGISTLDCFKPFGLNVADQIVIEDKGYKCLVAHFFTDATYNYDKIKVNLDNLPKYNHIILGHNHNYQVIKGTDKNPIALHPGSCRYESHAEEAQPCKFITEIDTIKQSLRLIPLKSPIPMKSFSTLKELLAIPKNTKVRWLVNDWNTYKKEVTEIGKLGLEYADFKVDWTKSLKEEKSKKEIKGKAEGVSMNVFLNEQLSSIKDDEVKKMLESGFKEEGLI